MSILPSRVPYLAVESSSEAIACLVSAVWGDE